jgi:predicted nuclease of predicted toxin-antitoxin system
VRFLLDQNAHARLVPFLSSLGHDATRIARDYPPGLPDSEVLSIAYREQRILITHDRHFGRLVFVELQPHAGVILLRLGSPAPLALTFDRLTDVLTAHAHALDQFIVVTPDHIRVRR